LSYPAENMRQSDLLQYYEALEKASADMLSAARNGDWSRVLEIENDCNRLIAQLKGASLNGELTPDEERRKLGIMRSILRHDAEIRQLAEPWIDTLAVTLADFPRVLH
jgi:flagellar protein FliT